MPALDQAAPSEDRDRAALQALISAGAPAKDILANPHLRNAGAELAARTPTIPSGVIPLQRFWRGRRYRDGRSFQQVLEILDSKARRFSRQIERDHRAIVVLGPPACGKSSIAEVLASRLHAALIDADDAKAEIDEFDEGRGSTAVHHESGLLAIHVLADTAKRGENLVLPKLGGAPAMLAQYVELLRGAGFQVVAAYVDVPFDEVIRRLAKRYLETGRIVDPLFVREVSLRSRQSFDLIKQRGLADGWLEIDGRTPEDRVTDSGGALWPELRLPNLAAAAGDGA